MIYQNIVVEVTDSIAVITLNRPKALNALNADLITELNNYLLKVEKDTEVRVIILTGSGEKSFVAGADIKEFSNFNQEQGEHLARMGQEKLFNTVENLNKPVIAAVNGFALGGGLELAMSAHFRIASDNARMGLPEVTLGLIPGYGGTQRLAHLVGKGKAMQMIMTAEMITAPQAEAVGLVNQVVAQGDLLATCIGIAKKIKSNSSNAIKNSIKCINASHSIAGFETEIKAFGSCFETPDFKEGVEAFLNKRKPLFK